MEASEGLLLEIKPTTPKPLGKFSTFDVPNQYDPTRRTDHEVVLAYDPRFRADLAVTAPVYWREFDSGNLKIYLDAFLNQRLPADMKVELSFLVNHKDGKPPELLDRKIVPRDGFYNPPNVGELGVERYMQAKNLTKFLTGLTTFQELVAQGEDSAARKLMVIIQTHCLWPRKKLTT